jgi:hypothetical protein
MGPMGAYYNLPLVIAVGESQGESDDWSIRERLEDESCDGCW